MTPIGDVVDRIMLRVALARLRDRLQARAET